MKRARADIPSNDEDDDEGEFQEVTDDDDDKGGCGGVHNKRASKRTGKVKAPRARKVSGDGERKVR